MSLLFYWIFRNLFHRVYEQLIFQVKRCNFPLHTGSWIRASFLSARNYTAIMERKIACITVNFEWIPNFASKQHFRSRLPLKFPSREQTELKRRCHVMFCGGNKTLVSNITAPWWSELPRGWKEVFCNTEETKLKFSCVTLKNKISASKVALWIACKQALHLGESRFTRHKWRAC